MKCRKARLEDLNSLVLLFDEYRVFYGQKPNPEHAANFIRQRMENDESTIFVGENTKNKIIGFVQLYPLFSSTRLKRIWLLNDLFVDKNYRGKGVSKKLLECAKTLCKETSACELSLETQKSNSIANQLYEKANFSLDIEHNFYSWSNRE